MHRFISALAFASLLTACGDDTASSDGASDITAVSDSAPTMVPFGKSGVGGNLEITVKSVEPRSKVGEYGVGPKLSPGETFVVVRYTLKNLGTKPIDGVNQPSVELIDSHDQSYARDTQAEIMESISNEDSSGALNPNVTSKQTAVWKLDKASFDRTTWRLKVPLDETLEAKLNKIDQWPQNSTAPSPLIFALK